MCIISRFVHICRMIPLYLHGYYHFHTRVALPLNARTGGEKYIHIGKQCGFSTHLWLQAYDTYKGTQLQHFKPEIIIGDRVSIGEFVHIGCITRIDIGNDVLMGSKIYITDHNHGNYSGVNQSSPFQPPLKRCLLEGKPIKIGDRVWIGEFVTILPGVTIGEGTIIGTHSTVTHDIPPNSIAVGSPARVIKRWNELQSKWISV
ncbi:hypothetical protein [uncultured Dialister sp.]|uniref:hypothetical protein n=1 Tax=uncultured Dialister sp. TaxID=278064 RepID=UPI0025FBFC76|nr:hypothetical protein [uncultured Dialister sp.]